MCGCLNCVLASVSQLSCTTAPLQRLRRAPWELRRRRDSGLSCTSDTRFNLCSKLRRAALVGACNYLLNGRLKQPLIHTTPRRSTGHPELGRPASDVKKQKKKSESEDSQIKNLLGVTEEHSTCYPERFTKQEERSIKIKFICKNSITFNLNSKFYFISLLCFMSIAIHHTAAALVSKNTTQRRPTP